MKNLLIAENGDLILTYKLRLIEKYTLSEEDYDQLNTSLNLCFKDLPDDIIYLKQDVYNLKKYDNSKLPEKNFLQKSYKNYWKNHTYLDDESYLFFIKKNKSFIRKDLINPFKIPKKSKFENFDKNIHIFFSEVNAIVQNIPSIVLSGSKTIQIEPVLEKEFLSYQSAYLSGFSALSVDIKKEWEYLRIGKQYSSILYFPSEEELPSEIFSCVKDTELSTDKSKFFKSYGDSFGLELDFKHVYNQIAILQNTDSILKIAEKSADEFYKARSYNSTNDTTSKKIKEEIKYIVDHKERIRFVKAHNNLIIFADSLKQLEDRITYATNKFRNMGIKPKRAFGDNLLALYFYSSPLYSSNLVESHLYLSTLQNFLSYNILTSKGREDNEGVYFNSRLDNTPILIDTWDAEKKYMNARNFMIIAPTGYGKSFTALHIINSYLNQGFKIVIVDLGGSYKNFHLLNKNNSAYITYEEGQSLNINPFELQRDAKTNNLILSAEKIEILLNFIIIHYKRENTPNNQEKATIRKIIPYYYKKSRDKKNFLNFIKFCNENKKSIIDDLEIYKEHFDFEEFLLLINEFGEKGVYNFLYRDDNKSTYDKNLFEKDIVIFELEKIQGNQLLLMVLLQLINVTIDEIIVKDPSVRSLVLCDEVAKQIQWEGMAKSIEYLYQTARKKSAAIGIVLQSITQLPDRYQAIIENTAVLYILYSNDYEILKDRFKMSDHATYLLSSIQENKAKKLPYREIFISRGNTQQIYRLAVDKATFWAFQTDGEANAKLMSVYEKTQDMEKTIKYIIHSENK